MLVKRIIEERLSEAVLSISKLYGGDINEVYRFTSSTGKYVIKCNQSLNFPEMLAKEAQGLNLLKKNGLKVPNVIVQFQQGHQQYLILELIEEGERTKSFWVNFGTELAALHNNKHQRFGLDYNNYIGSLEQQNDRSNSWEYFFITKRIKPLVRMAFDKKLIGKKHLGSFERFYKSYSELIPDEQPSLLHGDLWSGNLLCNINQKAIFIDPAIYFGHREMDISMTKMFGGFDPSYLDTYIENLPMEQGWENRIPIHNLYPKMVHLVLFGKSYLGGIENVIERY